MENRNRLPSSELGENNDLQLQDYLLKPAAVAPDLKPIQRTVTQNLNLDSDRSFRSPHRDQDRSIIEGLEQGCGTH